MDDQVRELVALGKEHFQRGDFSVAAGHLEQVVARGAAFADVHHMLGLIYHHLGEFESAQKAFEKALQINPDYIEAALNLAIVCNDLGQYERAQSIYGGAVAKARGGIADHAGDQPLDNYTRGKLANLHAQVGDGYASVRRPGDAAVEYRRALGLCPSFVDIRLKLANALKDAGDNAGALEEFRKAVQLAPAYLPARVALGVALYAGGKVDDAIGQWDEVLKADASNRTAAMYLKLARNQAPSAGGGEMGEIRQMTERAYALRFISGKYQGGEYPLQESGELVIGRSSELDMVLIEDMVSRKHAKIGLAPGQITIADLGSTNGTFVNGEKVKRARLKEGDRILIGTSILKLVAVSRAEGTAAPDARAAQQQLERSAAAQEKKTGGRSAVQGRLEEVPLVDLLQLLSTSKKTGAIVIKGYRGGRVHLRAGKVVSAIIDADPTLPPKKALFRMVAWTQGAFEFVPQEGELPPFPAEIAEGTETLVMEALQQGDDLARGDLPAATAAIGIAMPLTPRLRDLTPDEADLVQLVHNYGVVQAVLDRASGSDLEVSQKLAQLIERGFLRQF